MVEDSDDKHTRPRQIRIPDAMWNAYERVCERLGTTRPARLLDHIRSDIEQHGDERDRADLAKAERELEERRARRGGRPPRTG